jgi:hypothetical protein
LKFEIGQLGQTVRGASENPMLSNGCHRDCKVPIFWAGDPVPSA